MPKHEGVLFQEKTPEPEVFDPMAAKAEIDQMLKEHVPEIREAIYDPEKPNPLKFIFEASLADGLSIARQLKLTPAEIQKLTLKGDGWFGIKHPDVINVASSLVRNLQNVDIKEINLSNSFREVEDEPQDEVAKPASGSLGMLVEKLESYYREFLPYRMESEEPLGKWKVGKEKLTKEELDKAKKEEHVRRAENILFEKYIHELTPHIFPKVPQGSEGVVSISNKLMELGIPDKDEADRLASYIFVYSKKEQSLPPADGKAGENVFPLFAMNINGVRREWNLEKARKPVAKIMEQATKMALIQDIEKILNRNNLPYRIEKLPLLGKYRPIKETKHFSRGEAEALKISIEQKFQLLDDFFEKQTQPDVSDMGDISTWLEEVASNNEEFFESLELPGSGDGIPYSILLEASRSIKNPYLRKGFEFFHFYDAINNREIRGLPELLKEMKSGKLTILNSGEIADLEKMLVDSGGIENSEASHLLDAVNALDNPSLQNLMAYFSPKSLDEIKPDLEKSNTELKQFFAEKMKKLNLVRRAMSEKISSLLKTISAKPDKNVYALAESLVKACYPSEWQKFDTERKAHFTKYSSNAAPNAEKQKGGLTQDHYEAKITGSNVGEKTNEAPEKIATFTEPVTGMFVTNILGYDPVARTWKRDYVPVDGDLLQNRPTKKVVAAINTDIGRIVPTPLAARNLAVQGNEHTTLGQDSLGLVHIEGSRDISGWSYDVPEGVVAPTDVDDATYTRFLSRFIYEGGKSYIEKNPELPIECRMFVESIKTLSPRERVSKIQDFVTTHSFYDSYDNPIREEMNNAQFAERCTLMNERLNMLRDELGDVIPSQIVFAGVCADFAILTESLMRESGIATGVIQGYAMNGREMTSKNAHGKAGIFWPDANGKTMLVEIETTPPAVTAEQVASYREQGIAPEPITEKIERAKQEQIKEAEAIAIEVAQLEKELAEKLDHMEAVLAEGQKTLLSPAERKVMNEQVLALRKAIADYVQQAASLEDIAILKGVFDAIRFSPLTKMDQDNVESKVSGMQFVQGEYTRLKKEYEGRESPLERISHLGNNFIGDLDTMLYSSHAEGEDKAFIEYVSQVGEYGAKKIPENHAKILSMLKTYMRAKLA